MGANVRVLTGRVTEDANALSIRGQSQDEGKRDHAALNAKIAKQNAMREVAKTAVPRKVIRAKPAQLLILISTILAAIMVSQNIGLAQGNRGGGGDVRLREAGQGCGGAEARASGPDYRWRFAHGGCSLRTRNRGRAGSQDSRPQ